MTTTDEPATREDPALATPKGPRHRFLPPEKSLLYYLGSSISVAVLILVLAVAAVVIVIPKLSGGEALTVLTQSMEPGLPPGTLVVIHPADPDDIRIGQVITYQVNSGQPEVVSHRVISRTVDSDGTTTFITKGDNNAVADPIPVQKVQIRGVLWYDIPWIGYVNTWITGPSRAYLVPLIVAALFGYAVFMGVSELRERRRRRRDGGAGGRQDDGEQHGGESDAGARVEAPAWDHRDTSAQRRRART